ncbi:MULTISPECIES: hypothetical protein [Chryseobacterium]|uniref:hypothetical protein n=1 Tax=Chryseobacterium TaxID=59732 RepID=UPI001625537B|nr:MULTISPECIES: hypothetical protein [Chryseobacterium]MDM1554446.1 hypothetical protein [Chryseobacterium indologenes]
MKPTTKLNSITIAITTSIIFSLWQFLIKLSTEYPITTTLIGLATSLGVYRIIANFLIYLVNKSPWIKRKFLGPYFLEGTWVGFYIGASGNVRYIVEKFEQEIDSLVIRGKSFDENFNYHSSWISNSVNIDVISGRITYMYELIPLKEIKNNNGVCVFNFERDNQYSKPDGLMGFSADIHIGMKIRAKEIKISDTCKFSEKEAFESAKKVFEDTPNF